MTLRRNCWKPKTKSGRMEKNKAGVDELVQRLLSGESQAAAKLMTVLENQPENGAEIIKSIFPHTGKSFYIGVTGPAGAGKSTVVDRLIGLIRNEGFSVGVLAVDPSSPFTGGAILGDRIRMQRHFTDDGVFIRSLATRGSLGGLSSAARGCAQVLEAAGYDFIVFETVGVGQAEVDIVRSADTTVVLFMPGAGDSVQVLKAGLLEIADIAVVNKSDREGAQELKSEIELQLHLSKPKPWSVPVLLTCASEDEGMSEVWDTVKKHRLYLQQEGRLDEKKKLRLREDFMNILKERVFAEALSRLPGKSVEQALQEVLEGRKDPYGAVHSLLAEAGKHAGILIPKTKKNS